MTVQIRDIDTRKDLISLEEKETGLSFVFEYESFNCSLCQGDPHCRYEIKECNDSQLQEWLTNISEGDLLHGYFYGEHDTICEDLEKLLNFYRKKVLPQENDRY